MRKNDNSTHGKLTCFFPNNGSMRSLPSTLPMHCPHRMPGHWEAKTCTSPWTSLAKIQNDHTREKHKQRRDFHDTVRLATGVTIFDQVSKEGLSTARCKLISCSIEACDFPEVRSTASTCVGRGNHKLRAGMEI